MAIWKLKSCPRCQGDIYLDKDEDGWREHCLQCGHIRYLYATATRYYRNAARTQGRVPVTAGSGADTSN